MNSSVRSFLPIGTIGVGLVAVGHVWSTPGTLLPPAGPIEGTGRTLDEIYHRVDDVSIDLASLQVDLDAVVGPREYWFSKTAQDQLSPMLIAPGPILLHSITYYNIPCLAIYNGAGGNNQVAELSNTFQVQGGVQVSDETVNFGVHLEDGLYASWDTNGTDAVVTIVYSISGQSGRASHSP